MNLKMVMVCGHLHSSNFNQGGYTRTIRFNIPELCFVMVRGEQPQLLVLLDFCFGINRMNVLNKCSNSDVCALQRKVLAATVAISNTKLLLGWQCWLRRRYIGLVRPCGNSSINWPVPLGNATGGFHRRIVKCKRHSHCPKHPRGGLGGRTTITR